MALRRVRPGARPFLVRCLSGDLSYFHNPGRTPLRQATAGELLESAAATWPARTALVSAFENRSATFADLLKQVDRAGSGLVSLGLRPGSRLGVLAPNSFDHYVTALAAAKAGLVLVNINPALQHNEIEYCLQKAQVNALVIGEPFKTQDFHTIVSSVVPEILKAPPNIHFKSKKLPNFTTLISLSDKELPGTWRFSDLKIDATPELKDIERKIQPDDPFNIQFSSGTTGQPKAALLNHFTLVNNSFIFGRNNGFSDMHHTLCCQVPFFHTFGMSLGILGALNHGATLMLPGPSFNADLTVSAIKKHRSSIIYGTPTMYIDLCNQIKKQIDMDDELKQSLQDFKLIVSGGAVCSPSLFRMMTEIFNCPNVCSAYGMTETSPILMSSVSGDSLEQRMTTVGKVTDHTEMKVVDENGQMVPFGKPGEAWFRGYSTMLGYVDDEKKTKELITTCRWIKTGDYVVLRPDGYAQVVGRKKDIIIRGGENIFPSEVEEFLECHPEIVEAQIYGVPHERLGEEVCASILIKEGSSLTGDKIKEYCKGKIAHFKVPSHVKIVDQFPKTASGKIQKFKLREQMEKELRRTQ